MDVIFVRIFQNCTSDMIKYNWSFLIIISLGLSPLYFGGTNIIIKAKERSKTINQKKMKWSMGNDENPLELKPKVAGFQVCGVLGFWGYK